MISSLGISSSPEAFSVQDAVKRIEQGLADINTNAEWLRFLSFQSKFYHYSFNNAVLIFLQKPDACHVAGFTRWKSLGRFVKKGEKSIKIFAPCTYKSESEGDSTEKPVILKGFRMASVFDLSQTDGDDRTIPIVVRGLTDDGDDLAHLYEEIRGSLDIPVFETTDIAAKGCYDIIQQIIHINASSSITQKIKTLIHEYAHHVHHTRFFQGEDRQLGEVIAESAAYVVSAFLGLDTANYSLPYVKTWCTDIQKMKAAGDKIQLISSSIIQRITLSSMKPDNEIQTNVAIPA